MKLKNKILRITCDGGAATGKSTGAKLLAKKYKLAFLSSGLLYRYAAYLNLRYKPKNEIFFLKKSLKISNILILIESIYTLPKFQLKLLNLLKF